MEGYIRLLEAARAGGLEEPESGEAREPMAGYVTERACVGLI